MKTRRNPALKLKKQTLSYFFAETVHRYKNKKFIALVGDEPLTYGEFARKTVALANFLKEKGIKKGHKIVLLGDNSPNWAIAYFAISLLGAVVVPILSEFPESDINHILSHSEAVGAFVDDKFIDSMDLEYLNRMPAVFSLNRFAVLRDKSFKEESIWEKLQNLPGFFKRGMKNKIFGLGDNSEEDDLAEILYTSGTTGHSKGVMLTHRNIVSNALLGPDILGGLHAGSIVLNLLPLAHAYGCTTTFLGAFSGGAGLYLLSRKPSPKVLMDAMQQVKPTIVAGVPLVFEKIYHKKVVPQLTSKRTLRLISRMDMGRKFLYRQTGKKIMKSFGGRLETFVIGGASLNQEVETFLREAGVPFAIGYGLSECAPMVAGDVYKNLKFGSVGRPARDVEVTILEPDARSGVGEIAVKGPNVMQGYYKNPEETKKVFTKDGWLRTGDLAVMDKQRYLFIRGRSKNVHVGPSGENIYPEVVEDKLRESMFVEEALVYVENDKLTARIYLDYDHVQTVLGAPKHTVQPKEIDKILENIRKETNGKLPAYSAISQICEQPEPFEKTPTNKIKRMVYVPDYPSR
ncbi:MAG: AMP-binding protein [Calditrichia bacterium]